MKLIRNIFIVVIVELAVVSCSDSFLNLEPTDKISSQNLFSSPEGREIYMANLYYQLPIEDFTYYYGGFNYNVGGPNNNGFFPAIMTDQAVGSQVDAITAWGGGDFPWWEAGYKLIRDINLLINIIPDLDIGQQDKDALRGESHFIRAYAYFGLAKRYGGIPLIKQVQNLEGDIDALYVPRSTEKETWDFILEECDMAIQNLGDGSGADRRATKWAAYALKSRVALHAASVAKYWDRAPLSGRAVDAKLVGLNASDASQYYSTSINASEAIMNSGKFSLYKPDPASPIEAAENYRKLFEDPNRAPNEAIFIKGFSIPGSERGHNYDNWLNPNQTRGAWPHPGRFNPTLDFVDSFESYSSPGQSAPIVTTTDGNINNYNGFDPDRNYKRFNTPEEIFADKDARLWGTVILPGTTWKDETIIIQGGYIEPDGTPKIETNASINVNGVEYYTYGAPDWTLYSGFDPFGGNMTRSGFGFKKFLNQDYTPILAWNQSTTDWMDFRYAEILLNYAEAVVESGFGDTDKAAKAINDLRRRAAHTTDIPLTLDNVLRERKIELSFENKRYWDLIRRREYHTLFNNTMRHALVPILDLRVDPPQYIFVRKDVLNTNPHTFLTEWYYKIIPGIGSNNLIQNPQY